MRTLLALTTLAAVLSAVAYQYWFRPSEEELWLLHTEIELHRIADSLPKSLGKWQEKNSASPGVHRLQEFPEVVLNKTYHSVNEGRRIDIHLSGSHYRNWSPSVFNPSSLAGYTHLHGRTIAYSRLDTRLNLRVAVVSRNNDRFVSFYSSTSNGQWVSGRELSGNPYIIRLGLICRNREDLDDEALAVQAFADIVEFLEDFLPHLDPLLTEQKKTAETNLGG